ncbi:MAG TPA: serine hydrolase domain-containing protein [Acidimicrobiia bacterium]
MAAVLVAPTRAAVAAVAGPDANAALAAGLQADLASDPTVPGEALAVRAPGLTTALAVGAANTATGAPLKVDTPFRIASITKTFVAAAVLRLVEQGKVQLDERITRYLSPHSAEILRHDGYAVDDITVRQLLQHTSGLYDYATDPAYDDVNVTDPSHRWTRAEQLKFATEHGDPLFDPGQGYAYADTNYILLGELLERVTHKTLPAAVRTLLHFRRLGLDHTYWELLEPTPPGTPELAHQYYGTGFDNVVLDGSFDLYGGGGLVSTVDDLARIYRALFHDKVFDRRSTLRTMTTPSGPGRETGAGMGIFVVDVAGERCYAHRGYWGSQAVHCPGLDVTFARTFNQAAENVDDNALEPIIVDAVKSAQ